MTQRNRIWEELLQALANKYCLEIYTDKKRKWNRKYNNSITLTASVGALGFPITKYSPLFSSIMVALLSIGKELFPSVIQPESELIKLDSIYEFYEQYRNKIQDLWDKLQKEQITEHKAMELFTQLKESESTKQPEMNKLVRKISKKMQKEIDEKVLNYIKKVYYNNENYE